MQLDLRITNKKELQTVTDLDSEWIVLDEKCPVCCALLLIIHNSFQVDRLLEFDKSLDETLIYRTHHLCMEQNTHRRNQKIKRSASDHSSFELIINYILIESSPSILINKLVIRSITQRGCLYTLAV
jgi:hypothetical protein